MSKYFTYNSLVDLKNNSNTETIIREYTSIKDNNFLNLLINKYYDLLNIWADDNCISVNELYDRIELCLHDVNNLKIITANKDTVHTKLNLRGVILNMYWDIEQDA